MNQTFELLPEHIPVIAYKFADTEIDPNFIYQNGTLDGREILIPAHAMTCHPKFAKKRASRFKMYPHWGQDKHGDWRWLININSAKDGNYSFNTKSANFELNGKGAYIPIAPRISDVELMRREKERQAVQQRQAMEQQRKNANQQKLIEQYHAAPNELGDFPYMVTKFKEYAVLASSKDARLKRGNAYGKPCLMIPFNNLNDGGQLIFADGSKQFYGKSGGQHYFIKRPKNATDVILFGVGYATCMTVHLANSKATVVAFDAENLKKVVRKFAQDGYSNLEIIADNDIHDDPNKKNTGLTVAKQIAFEITKEFPNVSVKVFIPTLKNGGKCDFNDVFCIDGMPSVIEQLEADKAIYFKNGKSNIPEEFEITTANKKGELITKYQKLASSQISAQKLSYFLLNYATAIKENKRDYWKGKIYDKILEPYPSLNTREFFVSKAFELLKTESIEIVRAEIYQRCEEKAARVLVRNTPSKANLNTFRKVFDFKNEVEAIELFTLLGSNQPANVFFHIPMGMGKTEYIDYLFETILENIKTLVILPRVSLAVMLSNLFEIASYKDTGREKYTAKQLSCVVNSMLDYLGTTPEIAIFDEIRITLESVLDGKTMKRTQREIFERLKKLLSETTKNFFFDADLNAPTVDFICKHSDKPSYYVIDSRPRKYSLPPVNYLGNCHENMRHKILEDLKAGLNLFVNSDSKGEPIKTKTFIEEELFKDKEMTDIYNYLKSNKQNDILLITQETKGEDDVQEFLTNPNEESKKYRCVLVSPIIQVGVSITNGHFHKTYALLGSGQVTSNEAVQSMYRIRDVEQIVLSIKQRRRSENDLNKPTVEMCVDGYKLIAKRETFEEILKENDELAGLHFQAKNARESDILDFANNVLLHLQNCGFTVNYNLVTDIDMKKDNGLAKRVKEQQRQAIKSAQSITYDVAKELEGIAQAKGLKQYQSDLLARHRCEHLQGIAPHTQSQLEQIQQQRIDGNEPLNEQTILDDQNGYSRKVRRYLLAQKDTEELRDIDEENRKIRIAKNEEFERDVLFDLLEKIKQKSKVDSKKNKNGKITATENVISAAEALEICKESLKPFARQLASNGHANYDRQFTRPIQTLRNLLDRWGYQVKLFRRDGTTNRVAWFTVKLDEKVRYYAAAQIENAKRSSNYQQ